VPLVAILTPSTAMTWQPASVYCRLPGGATGKFVADAPGGRGSIRDSLVHAFDTQIVHAAWLDGSMTYTESCARNFPPQDYPDVASVRMLCELAA